MKCGQVVLENEEGCTDLGFAQPVHISRLIPFDLACLETSIGNEKLRLELIRPDGSAIPATVTSQTASGLVRLAFDTYADMDGLYDLTLHEYRWLGNNL